MSAADKSKKALEISFFPTSATDPDDYKIAIYHMPKEYHDTFLELFCHICDKLNRPASIHDLAGNFYRRKARKFEMLPPEKVPI